MSVLSFGVYRFWSFFFTQDENQSRTLLDIISKYITPHRDNTPKQMMNEVKSSISSAPDVESPFRQEPTLPKATAAAVCRRTQQCREGIGSNWVLLSSCHILVGFIASYFYSAFPMVSLISTIVIASVMTCGFCCASNFNLKCRIKNKKWIVATLVMIMPFVLILRGLIISKKIIAEVEGGCAAAPPFNTTVPHWPTPQMMVDVVLPSGGGVDGWQSLKNMLGMQEKGVSHSKTWRHRVWEFVCLIVSVFLRY